MLMSEFLSTKATEMDDKGSGSDRSPSPVARTGESFDEFKERKAQEKKDRKRRLEEKKCSFIQPKPYPFLPLNLIQATSKLPVMNNSPAANHPLTNSC